jgi:hypothetical protein
MTSLRDSPDAASLMAQRIPDWLNTSTQTWVDMKNALLRGNSEHAYRVLPAFNTLSTVRATMLKSMSQLRPPMPAPPETIDELLRETVAINYRLVGAPVVRLGRTITPAPGQFRPVTFLARNTIRGKKLAPKFFPAGYRDNDPDDASCDSVCAGAPYPGACSWELRKPCYLKNEAETMAKMAADPVVRMAQAMMRGVSGTGAYPVYDEIYFQGEGFIPGGLFFK